ncbi:MAG TPA: glycosyltransferase family 2 protein [Verrucomicrobiae bacterium]|nr:glycosyltransferase family 2 protein [Verrucomicrobiae bacterium]
MSLPSQKLSIVIPVYNESGTIADVISRVQASVARQKLDAEIIVVNDGSKDNSAEIIKTIPGIVFVNKEKNGGKGSAVKAGFAAATGAIFLIQDADLEYNPDDYTAVITPILKGETEVTMGSRFIKEKPVFFGKRKSPYLAHYIGNRMIIWLTNCLYWNNATDYEGCYKAFTSRVIRSIPIRSDGFEYDNELICKILRKRYKIVEVPIEYHPRSYESGKKITWRHGLRMLWAILKYRFIN